MRSQKPPAVATCCTLRLLRRRSSACRGHATEGLEGWGHAGGGTAPPELPPTAATASATPALQAPPNQPAASTTPHPRATSQAAAAMEGAFSSLLAAPLAGMPAAPGGPDPSKLVGFFAQEMQLFFAHIQSAVVTYSETGNLPHSLFT